MNQFVWAQMAVQESERPASVLRWLRSRSGLLVIGMVLSILAIAALSLWDVKRRNAASMEDFGRHQVRLARALASNLQTQLSVAAQPDGSNLAHGLSELRKLEQPGTWVALVWPPDAPGFIATDGKAAPPGLLLDVIAQGRDHARLHRNIATQLGLPTRAAIAGLAKLEVAGRPYWLAVVVTARRAREREEEASWRALLAVIVAAGAVLGLGGLALHWQRQELRTQQALALEEAHRRREAELERASRAATLGTLAMGITHELSTPLGIIAARAEQLLSRMASDERASRGAQVIQEQAGRMGQIIRGILGLVRDEAPIADRLSPAAVCQGAMMLVRHRFAETAVELRLDATSDASLPLLRGDQRLLEQALVNLLLNACDACSAHGLVELRVRKREKQVLFRVTDNGSGISPEAAARAMEPFFTTKPAGKGTGLGLAVTHEIVKSHRGRLVIGPRDEGGTCAELSLPLCEETSDHGE